MTDAPPPPQEVPSPAENIDDSLLSRLRRITGITSPPPQLEEPVAQFPQGPPPVESLMAALREAVAVLTASAIAVTVFGIAGLIWLWNGTAAGWRLVKAKTAAWRARRAALPHPAERNPSAARNLFTGLGRTGKGLIQCGAAIVRFGAAATRWVAGKVSAIRKSARNASAEEKLSVAAPAPVPNTPSAPETVEALALQNPQPTAAPEAAAPPRRRRSVRFAAAALLLILPAGYWVKPVRYFFTGLAGRGNAEVIVAADGWLFPRSETEPSERAPLKTLRQTAAALKSQGTALVVVSVPAKSAVYPEKISAGPGGLQRQPSVTSGLDRIRELGAVVVDLGPVLYGLKSSDGTAGPVFPRHSSWWSPRAMQEGAAAAANAVQQLPGFAALPLRPSPMVMQKDRGAATMDDLVAGLRYGYIQKHYPAEEINLIRLVSAENQEPPVSDPAAPVLLLGGDAVAVYDDPAYGHPAKSAAGRPGSAGFAQYLAWHLSVPLEIHTRSGSGTEAAADWLQSQAETRGNPPKKVIVWVLTDAALLR